MKTPSLSLLPWLLMIGWSGIGPLPAADLTPDQEAKAAAEKVYPLLQKQRGLPQGEDWQALRSWMSPELVGLIEAAQQEQAEFTKARPDEKPPWVEGDLFSSLFEGVQSFTLGPVRVQSNQAEVPVACVHEEGGHRAEWTDVLILVQTAQGWRLDDVNYGGSWAFANTGSLKAALRPWPGGDPEMRQRDWLPSPDALVLPVQGTGSPCGRYAIGWGYEKGPVDWKKLAHPEETNSGWGEVTFSTKLAPEPLDPALEDDANFLFDLRTGKALAKLAIYYPGERPSFNHDTLEAVWSPRSACVMLLVSGKWENEFAHIAWIDEEGKCAGSQDVLEPLRLAAAAAARKSTHPAARRLRAENDYGYSVDEVRLSDDGRFTAVVSGEVPKLDEDAGYFQVEMEGRFLPAKEGESALLETTRVRVRPLEE